jgi:hypothetical protein
VAILPSACDLFLPAKPPRPENLPELAGAVYWPKVGWGWSLCLDAPAGSTLFTWSAEGFGPHMRVRGQSCAAATAPDERKHLRVEGDAGSFDFLFPEAPADKSALVTLAPCPRAVDAHELAALAGVLRAAGASDKLPEDVAKEALAMASSVEDIGPDDLVLVGGIGNTESWSVRCSRR